MSLSKGCVREMKYFLLLFNFLGIFQNVVVNNELRDYRWWSICIFFTWLLCFVSDLCVYIFYYLTTTRISIKNRIDSARDVLTLASVMMDMLFSYWSQNLFMKFFTKMGEYDEKVKKIKCFSGDNYRILWIYCMLGNALVVISIIILIHESTELLPPYELQTLIPAKIVIALQFHCCLKFMIMVYTVLRRFQHFNNVIRSTFCTNAFHNTTVLLVHDVKYLHYILSKGIEYLKEIYGKVLLLWFSVLVGNILIISYLALVTPSATSTIGVIYMSLQIILLCGICHNTVQEEKRVILNVTLYYFSVLRSDATLDKFEVTMYFLHNRASLTAGEFFKIDFTLLQSFFAKLEYYDDQAKSINNNKIDKLGFIPWMLLLFTVIITERTTTDIIRISKKLEMTIAKIISYVTPLFINTYCVLLHVIFVYLLMQRFKHLNKAITSKSSNPTAKNDRQNVTVYDVRLLYSVLFDSVKELNNVYGFATLILYLSSIINLLVAVHGLIYYSTETNLTLVVITLLQIIPLSIVCHLTAEKAKQVREWITDREGMFRHCLNGMESLKTMLYYYNKPVFFTVGNFFHINYSLLLSIGSILLTYLVILIQMS